MQRNIELSRTYQIRKMVWCSMSFLCNSLQSTSGIQILWRWWLFQTQIRNLHSSITFHLSKHKNYYDLFSIKFIWLVSSCEVEGEKNWPVYNHRHWIDTVSNTTEIQVLGKHKHNTSLYFGCWLSEMVLRLTRLLVYL